MNEKYNNLTIIERVRIPFEQQTKYKAWHVTDYAKCICDCGNETLLPYNAVKIGFIKSCGCAKRKASQNNMKQINKNKPIKLISYLDKEWTVKEFEEHFNVPSRTIYRCLNNGLDPESIARKGLKHD
jgi:hypothetical protein